jgi:hypothetical protein
VKKALGRCAQGHCTVTEHAQGTIPEGVCKFGHVLCEWATNPGRK